MKKIVLLSVAVFTLLGMTACSPPPKNNHPTSSTSKESEKEKGVVYPEKEFESLLNSGFDMKGKTVEIKAIDYRPNSQLGYNIWAGDHLNFISDKEPNIEIGETAIVTITDVVSSFGSWYISYENGKGPVKVTENTELRKKLKKTEDEAKKTNKSEEQAALESKNKVTSKEQEKEPSIPAEYQNAHRKAQTYSNILHMSKAGIYDQLISSYGDNFASEAAQYAVDNLQTDYCKNALEKAKNYQETMGMSRNSIYDQLISDHGEKFTSEEAQYAVDNLPA